MSARTGDYAKQTLRRVIAITRAKSLVNPTLKADAWPKMTPACWDLLNNAIGSIPRGNLTTIKTTTTSGTKDLFRNSNDGGISRAVLPASYTGSVFDPVNLQTTAQSIAQTKAQTTARITVQTTAPLRETITTQAATQTTAETTAQTTEDVSAQTRSLPALGQPLTAAQTRALPAAQTTLTAANTHPTLPDYPIVVETGDAFDNEGFLSHIFDDCGEVTHMKKDSN
jgi:hypothetical protein